MLCACARASRTMRQHYIQNNHTKGPLILHYSIHYALKSRKLWLNYCYFTWEVGKKWYFLTLWSRSSTHHAEALRAAEEKGSSARARPLCPRALRLVQRVLVVRSVARARHLQDWSERGVLTLIHGNVEYTRVLLQKYLPSIQKLPDANLHILSNFHN